MYTGENCAKDIAEGFKWLTKAAIQNDSNALYVLAIEYFHGTEIEKDTEKAADYLLKSAELGNEDAIEALGSSEFVFIKTNKSS